MKELIKKFAPQKLILFYHFILSFLGAVFYRFPSQDITVIGVTGTNGKSTVVEMISKILETAGYRIASLSSIKFKIGEREWPNALRMTMPGRFLIQRFLRKAVDSGCAYAILEVTSEGIKQYRHRFIDFSLAVFTNLAPEHIEVHGGFEKYRQSKMELFEKTKIHVINLDDKNAKYFLDIPAYRKYGFTIKGEEEAPKKEDKILKIIEAHDCRFLPTGVSFMVKAIQFDLKLLGGFNIYNALAAIAVAQSQWVDLEICKKALEQIRGIPGRMEEVISQPFKVFVDYAFTPNALEQVYQTVREKLEPQKLICVLGACGGGRDKWKRPVLGELAAGYCDEIIITNEDPYDEDPTEIVEQVAKGSKGKAKKILDRREAIKAALLLAQKDDIVLITGKGSEPSIRIGKSRMVSWDDRKVVKEEFEKITFPKKL